MPVDNILKRARSAAMHKKLLERALNIQPLVARRIFDEARDKLAKGGEPIVVIDNKLQLPTLLFAS